MHETRPTIRRDEPVVARGLGYRRQRDAVIGEHRQRRVEGSRGDAHRRGLGGDVVRAGHRPAAPRHRPAHDPTEPLSVERPIERPAGTEHRRVEPPEIGPLADRSAGLETPGEQPPLHRADIAARIAEIARRPAADRGDHGAVHVAFAQQIPTAAEGDGHEGGRARAVPVENRRRERARAVGDVVEGDAGHRPASAQGHARHRAREQAPQSPVAPVRSALFAIAHRRAAPAPSARSRLKIPRPSDPSPRPATRRPGARGLSLESTA